MQRTIERLEGDTHGLSYELTVLRFSGSIDGAPKAYIQAALHGDEMPGVVAIDALMPMMRKAEAEGRIRGDITVVPWANPVGRGTYVFGKTQGRFATGSRTNFNRDFPAVPSGEPASPDLRPLDVRLKSLLLGLSAGHDIVLDLHCDDEGLAYLYVPAVLWPHMADCAAAMGIEAVILWDGASGRSFDEASINARLAGDPARTVVTTVEFRGQSDVDRDLAAKDGLGIYRLLVARGVVADAGVPASGPFTGDVASIDHVEMMPSPVSGVILFDVEPGDRVKAGQRLATIVNQPGEEGGSVDVLAPQDGFILTRRSHRQTMAGEDLFKLVGVRPSAAAREGALEA